MSTHHLTYSPGNYYKITTDLDCSVNVEAIGGGGGGGYRGESESSRQFIFSSLNLTTTAGPATPGIKRVVGSGYRTKGYSQFTSDYSVWNFFEVSYDSGEGPYTVISPVNIFDITFTVNFPAPGQYIITTAVDDGGFIEVTGIPRINLAWSVETPVSTTITIPSSGNRQVRFYVTNYNRYFAAAFTITQILDPVVSPGGSGLSGTKVTTNGIKLSKDEALYVFVGEGGKAATDSSWGNGGAAFQGYNGGNGGKAFGRGGNGGGGGGATCVWKASKNDPWSSVSTGGLEETFRPGFYETPGNLIYTSGIVAPGGGGGGGGGSSGDALFDGSRLQTYLYKNQPVESVTWSSYNQFMNQYAVASVGKFYTSGSHDFYRRISIPSSDNYRVFIAGDDYVSVYLDNVPLIGGGANFTSSQTPNFVDTYIEAGEHTISAYYENFGSVGACAIAITRASNGEVVWNTRSNLNSQILSTEVFAKSYGGRGVSNSFEGGAGGGGGGGSVGGRGGTYLYSNSATGGYNGSRGFTWLGTELGVGASGFDTPILYNAVSYGSGGNAEQDGVNGLAVIESTGSLNIYVRDNGQWVPVKEIKYRENGSWTNITEVQVKDNDTLKKVFSYDSIPLTQATIGVSGITSYNFRALSNPPVWERLPQSQLKQVISISQSDSSGDSFSVISSSTQTFDDGSTLTTTTYSDGTQSFSSTDAPSDPPSSTDPIDGNIGGGW